MPEVTITKLDGSIIHFIDATCKTTDDKVFIKQFVKGERIIKHTFNKKDIKSVIY